MSRDKNLKEVIESTLSSIGINNTGDVAQAVWDSISERQADFVAEEVELRMEIKVLRGFVLKLEQEVKALL